MGATATPAAYHPFSTTTTVRVDGRNRGGSIYRFLASSFGFLEERSERSQSTREKISFLEAWPMMRKTGEPLRSRMMVAGTTSPSWKLCRVAAVAPVKTERVIFFLSRKRGILD